MERESLAGKLDDLEDEFEKLSAENLSLKTKLANFERESKRPMQDYADFQNLNHKLQVIIVLYD